MAKFNILLISANGLVGEALYKELNKNNFFVLGTYYDLKDPKLHYADIQEPHLLENLFIDLRPDVVILNAALANVEFCEVNPEVSKRINVYGTKNVVDLCNKYNSKLVFFSSDYIFDGFKGPYTEEAVPRPLNIYGKHKLLAEESVKTVNAGFLIIRTTVVYGNDPLAKNFVVNLINLIKKAESFRTPIDQIGTPTYSLNLASIVVALINLDATGIFNVVGNDRLTRYDFALAVCEEFGLSKELIVPVLTSQLKQKALRPLSAGLTINKVKSVVNLPIVGVKEGLHLFHKELHECERI